MAARKRKESAPFKWQPEEGFVYETKMLSSGLSRNALSITIHGPRGRQHGHFVQDVFGKRSPMELAESDWKRNQSKYRASLEEMLAYERKEEERVRLAARRRLVSVPPQAFLPSTGLVSWTLRKKGQFDGAVGRFDGPGIFDVNPPYWEGDGWVLQFSGVELGRAAGKGWEEHASMQSAQKAAERYAAFVLGSTGKVAKHERGENPRTLKNIMLKKKVASLVGRGRK